MRLCAVIRAYNEAGAVMEVVADVRRYLPSAVVVVIDDGSADATAAQARAAGARVVQLPFNLGMGAAVQTGYRLAYDEGFDVAVQIDGDGQHPGVEAARVVEALCASTDDIVIGSRFAQPGGYRSTWPRRMGIRVASFAVSRVAGTRITDATSGLRAVGRPAIEVFARDYPSDYVETESLLVAVRHGLRIGEVPVAMLPRRVGRSTIRPLQSAAYGARLALGVALASTPPPRTLPG